MTITFNNKFNIGDRVYYATPDGDQGIIIDIKYSVLEDRCKYIVSFGRLSSDEICCLEMELSLGKVF